MTPRITNRKKLLALAWPEDAPVLTEDDLAPRLEESQHKRHLWAWLRETFDRDCPQERVCYEQFLHLLLSHMLEAADPRDRPLLVFSDVPSPSVEADRRTKAYYSPREVAAWWNAALRDAGYEFEEP